MNRDVTELIEELTSKNDDHQEPDVPELSSLIFPLNDHMLDYKCQICNLTLKGEMCRLLCWGCVDFLKWLPVVFESYLNVLNFNDYDHFVGSEQSICVKRLLSQVNDVRKVVACRRNEFSSVECYQCLLNYYIVCFVEKNLPIGEHDESELRDLAIDTLFEMRDNFVDQAIMKRPFMAIIRPTPSVQTKSVWEYEQQGHYYTLGQYFRLREQSVKLIDHIRNVNQDFGNQQFSLGEFVLNRFITDLGGLNFRGDEKANIIKKATIIAYMYLNRNFRLGLFKVASSSKLKPLANLYALDIFTARDLIRRYSIIDQAVERINSEEKTFFLCFVILLSALANCDTDNCRRNEAILKDSLRDYLIETSIAPKIAIEKFNDLMIVYDLIKVTCFEENLIEFPKYTRRVDTVDGSRLIFTLIDEDAVDEE